MISVIGIIRLAQLPLVTGNANVLIVAFDKSYTGIDGRFDVGTLFEESTEWDGGEVFKEVTASSSSVGSSLIIVSTKLFAEDTITFGLSCGDGILPP